MREPPTDVALATTTRPEVIDVVDMQRPEHQDPLNDLFGDIAFDRMLAESPGPVAPPPPSVPSHSLRSLASAPPPAMPSHEPQSHAAASLAAAPPPRIPQAPAAVAAAPAAYLPSRRELREAPAASTRSSRSRGAAKSGAATKSTVTPSRKRRVAKGSAGAPQPFARPVDSAYPAGRVLVVVRHPTKKKAKKGSGLLTMLAVIGLFGSVALPAYAFAPKSDDDIAAASKVSSDAAVSVSDKATLSITSRGVFGATSSVELKKQRSTNLKAANYAAYLHSGARELGDDYPWFSELSTNQGGGLSPLNYFARECVDFVAWRLNRDAGSLHAPFLYDWSTLTPTGGNAYQWKYAWKAHGWPSSTTPIVGSVAWFSANHVAYVKAVNGDGTVLIEEYNWMGQHVYGQRTIAATDAQLYLYPPPR